MSPEDFAIVSGRIYNRRKKQGERTDLTSGQVGIKFDTAAEVADELGASPRTIKRNGQRAEVFDKMQDIGDEEAAQAAKEVPWMPWHCRIADYADGSRLGNHLQEIDNVSQIPLSWNGRRPGLL